MEKITLTDRTTVYLGLGSNLGDRLGYLQQALAALAPQVSLAACSSVYETEPWGFAEQAKFLNQAAAGETTLPPRDLLAHLKAIEAALGRAPTFRYGPRCIDIDILLYGDLILESPDLTIPHPRLHERAFVLLPLADLAPDLRHPVLHKSIRQLLAELPGAQLSASPLF